MGHSQYVIRSTSENSAEKAIDSQRPFINSVRNDRTMTGEPVTYVIDGARIRTLEDVFTVAGEKRCVAKVGISDATWMPSPTASLLRVGEQR